MNSNKRDIFFDGKIYQDANFGYVPGNSQYAKDYLSTLTNYPVQGDHSFKDGEDVTGKYNLYNDCELHPGCYCVMNGKDETQCKRYNPVAHEIKADLPLPASTGEGVKDEKPSLKEVLNLMDKLDEHLFPAPSNSGDKNLTAMGDVLELIELRLEDSDPEYCMGLELIRREIYSQNLLAKEREQIIDAYDAGMTDWDGELYKNKEGYYTQTFK